MTACENRAYSVGKCKQMTPEFAYLRHKGNGQTANCCEFGK